MEGHSDPSWSSQEALGALRTRRMLARGRDWFRSHGMLVVLLLMMLSISLVTPHFLTPRNLLNLGLQSCVVAIVAMGETFILISGGIDLSVGSVVGLSACLMAGLVKYEGWPEVAGILLALAIGIGMGVFNGLVITKTRVDPIIVTLGTWYIGRGALETWIGNRAPTAPHIVRILGAGKIGPIPIPLVITAIIFIASHLVLTRTPLGRYCFAIGGNERTARLSGINVDRYRLIYFIICGLLASVAAIVLTGRLYSVYAGTGQGYVFEAPAAAIVGGTSLFGGRGSIGNAIVGALIMGVISNGLDLTKISFFWQQVAVGAVIILAVSVDALRGHRR